MKFIAAHLRKNIHDRPARRCFAHSPEDSEVYLLRRADLRDVRRDAQSLKAHAQALDMNLAFITTSTMRLKNAEDWTRDAADIISLNVERRRQGRQTEILSATRDGIDHFVR